MLKIFACTVALCVTLFGSANASNVEAPKQNVSRQGLMIVFFTVLTSLDGVAMFNASFVSAWSQLSMQRPPIQSWKTGVRFHATRVRVIRKRQHCITVWRALDLMCALVAKKTLVMWRPPNHIETLAVVAVWPW